MYNVQDPNDLQATHIIYKLNRYHNYTRLFHLTTYVQYNTSQIVRNSVFPFKILQIHVPFIELWLFQPTTITMFTRYVILWIQNNSLNS